MHPRRIAPLSSPGVTARPLRPGGDDEGVHAVSQAAFDARPDFSPESLDEFRAEHLDHAAFAPDLSLVADRDGELVGIALCKRWEGGRGYVDILAVHPDAAGRGVGRALLRATLAGFRTAGLRHALLTVAGDNPRALGLYEAAGMAPRWRVDSYERPAG